MHSNIKTFRPDRLPILGLSACFRVPHSHGVSWISHHAGWLR